MAVYNGFFDPTLLTERFDVFQGIGTTEKYPRVTSQLIAEMIEAQTETDSTQQEAIDANETVNEEQQVIIDSNEEEIAFHEQNLEELDASLKTEADLQGIFDSITV